MATCIQFDASGFAVLAAGEPSTCTAVLLSGTEYAQIQAAQSVDISYPQAGAVFSFFFGFTLAAWYVAKNVGLLLEAVRRF